MKGFKTIYFKKDTLYILDQRFLPQQVKYVKCKTGEDVFWAIKKMKIRGAPAIGVSAGFGVVLEALRNSKLKKDKFLKHIRKTIKKLSKSRPTAWNLFWVLNKMEEVLKQCRDYSVSQISKILLKKAEEIFEKEKQDAFLIGKYGSQLINENDKILTICNAGALATVDWGTALSIIYQAHQQGKNIKVYACETRPLLQGARLTVWELLREKVKVILTTDFGAGRLFQEKKIDKVIIGADRITSTGDVANKIGSFTLSLLAHFHKVPFYVAAPLSTFDLSIRNWEEIPIEQRHKKEVIYIKNIPITHPKVEVFNPAFDCVPHRFITAIITNKGIIWPPFEKNIKKLVNNG